MEEHEGYTKSKSMPKRVEQKHKRIQVKKNKNHRIIQKALDTQAHRSVQLTLSKLKEM